MLPLKKFEDMSEVRKLVEAKIFKISKKNFFNLTAKGMKKAKETLALNSIFMEKHDKVRI